MRDIERILAIPKQSDAVRAPVDLFAEQAMAMLEASSRPEVFVAALPADLICKLVNGSSKLVLVPARRRSFRSDRRAFTVLISNRLEAAASAIFG